MIWSKWYAIVSHYFNYDSGMKHGDHTLVPIHTWAHTIVPWHICAHTRLCPHTFVPTHVCAHTHLCPDMLWSCGHNHVWTETCTFVPRHDCTQTRLFPRSVCAHTRLCPYTFVPTHVCVHTCLYPHTLKFCALTCYNRVVTIISGQKRVRLCPDKFVPRYIFGALTWYNKITKYFSRNTAGDYWTVVK